MVHSLSIVCRSVVWFAVLLVSSVGRVAGFSEVRRVSCGVVFLTRRSVTVSPTSVRSVLASILCGVPVLSISCLGKGGIEFGETHLRLTSRYRGPSSSFRFRGGVDV